MSGAHDCGGPCKGHDAGDGVQSAGRTWWMTDPYGARPAVEPTGDLREDIAEWLRVNLFWGLDPSRKYEAADLLLALPAVRDALAAQEDAGDLIRAVADDFLAEFPPDDGDISIDDTYDWLIAKAQELDKS